VLDFTFFTVKPDLNLVFIIKNFLRFTVRDFLILTIKIKRRKKWKKKTKKRQKIRRKNITANAAVLQQQNQSRLVEVLYPWKSAPIPIAHAKKNGKKLAGENNLGRSDGHRSAPTFKSMTLHNLFFTVKLKI
jgi:hypothetical protein